MQCITQKLALTPDTHRMAHKAEVKFKKQISERRREEKTGSKVAGQKQVSR